MIVLAFGGNLNSSDQEQARRFKSALSVLAQADCRLIGASSLYSTPPLGRGRQGRYLNAVAVFDRGPPPAPLLVLLKRIERAHGRRYGYHWGPRVLDLDILFHGSRVVGWPVHQRRRGIISLPHPELDRRAFVMVPLAEVEDLIGHPIVHPVFGLSMGALLRRRGLSPRGIRRVWSTGSWATD